MLVNYIDALNIYNHQIDDFLAKINIYSFFKLKTDRITYFYNNSNNLINKMIIKLSSRIISLFFLVLTSLMFSQNNTNDLWENVSGLRYAKNSEIDVSNDTKFYKLDLQKFKEHLLSASKRGESLSSKTDVIISFPDYSGEFNRFRIVEASVMAPELQSKFPGIRSYAGQGVDNPNSIIRFSISDKKGITSMERSLLKSDTFIELYSERDNVFAVFSKSNRIKSDFSCKTEDFISKKTSYNSKSLSKDANTGVLHTFRLALSCTGEYGSGVGGGTIKGVMAEFNATMTRVNGIFENDFSSTMILIPNESDIIYFNPDTDPYSSGLSISSELQSNLTSVIGESNYDIGHVFNQAGNDGYAGCIGCLCVDGLKGSAYTQSTVPKGVNFDVDYVAHEMGHQFGGNHTFTVSNEDTGANLEPGSGSTIMGYAGITGNATDVQQNSDPYFLFFTIEQVTDHVASRTCDIENILSQAEPTVDAGSDFIIPAGTAFKLTGSGTVDALGSISYCWEQNDIGGPSNTLPSSTGTSGPSFRSFEASISPTRYFPKLPVVFSGSLGQDGDWEVINDVSRDYSFKLTVRDNIAGGGQNKIDEMAVFVDDSFGPFIVTSQVDNTSWTVGTTQTITWDVANTNEGTVNAQKVNILFTDNQGLTFTTLVSGVDNNGSHNIIVPSIVTNSGRIMIEAADNIFFAVNSGVITINEEEFVLDFPIDNKDLCSGDSEIEYEFTYRTFLGYNETTIFSVLNKPVGTIVTFNPSSSSINGENVIMNISSITSSNIGENTIIVKGTSSDTGIVSDATIKLNIINENLEVPNQIYPANNETNIAQPFNLLWSSVLGTETYVVEIFDNNSISGTPIQTAETNNVTYEVNSLSNYTDYWWRVRAKNDCGVSDFSDLFKFTTIDIDSDSDGVLDYLDNCINVSNPNQEDIDGNGIGDLCQDLDADGVIDINDNCPNIYNPNQDDSDGNGIGDLCQDTDGDSIIDINDNCILTPNTNQSDQNNDGVGDVCETPEPADTITPNGDMQNDGWYIKNIEYVTNKVTVFSRNGVKVFEDKDYVNNSWKGESNQGGNGLLPAGSYYYIINYVTTKGEAKSLTGWIYINY